MSSVQYMRGYLVDELVDLQTKIQHVLADYPDVVAMAILAIELHRRLKGKENEDDVPSRVIVNVRLTSTPTVVLAATEALDRLVPVLVGVAVDGISLEESIS